MVSDKQLLYCTRNAIRQVMSMPMAASQQTLLGAVDSILNELLLRQNTSFSIDCYVKGLQLAKQGSGYLLSTDSITSDLRKKLQKLPEQLPNTISSDELLATINQLNVLLHQIVKLLPNPEENLCIDYLDELNQWEVDQYAYRLEEAPEPNNNKSDVELTAEKFQHYLRTKFPEWTDITVTELSPLPGGFSKKTCLVRVEDPKNGKQSLVIRAQQATNILNLVAEHITAEHPIVKIAFDAGIRVAEPLWLEADKSLLGTCFMVSKLAPGENLGTATGATQEITNRMAKSLVEEAARIHQINLNHYQAELKESVFSDWYPGQTIAERVPNNIRHWRMMAESLNINSPLIERGLRWLENNIAPCDEPATLIHGDYGLHNILIDNGQVSAILDWEAVQLGDPAEELSWLLACTSQYIERENLLALYADSGGRNVSEFRLRYFDVLQCLRMPIACLAALKLLEIRLDNIQYAAFGLRFIHHNASCLIECIRKAEAAKKQIILE